MTKLYAVYVTYNPQVSRLMNSLNLVLHHATKVVVVDNNSDHDLAVVLNQYEFIHLIRLKENNGLGLALNRGIRFAISQGAEFVLLMDQDSIPSQDMISILLNQHQALADQGEEVAAVGPQVVLSKNPLRTIPFKKFILFIRRSIIGSTRPVVEADYLITSGTLLHTGILKEVGWFNELFFIDYVDVEWGLRAMRQGFHCYGISHAKLYHQLGELKPAQVRRSLIPYHKPFRYYYICRNPFLLARESGIPFYPKLFFILLTFFRLPYLCFNKIPNKGDCIKHMAMGIIDGILQLFGMTDKARKHFRH